MSNTNLTNVTPSSMVLYLGGKGSGSSSNSIPATVDLEIFFFLREIPIWPKSQVWFGNLNMDSRLPFHNSRLPEFVVVKSCRVSL